MRKRTWTMAALALVALFGVNRGTAKAEWQSIKEVQENTPERWTESYETKWRTIQIDAQIDVPDVEKLPVIRVTGTSPVNGLKLLPYSEVVYNEVGQFWETMRITRTDITLQTVKFPRFKRKITL